MAVRGSSYTRRRFPWRCFKLHGYHWLVIIIIINPSATDLVLISIYKLLAGVPGVARRPHPPRPLNRPPLPSRLRPVPVQSRPVPVPSPSRPRHLPSRPRPVPSRPLPSPSPSRPRPVARHGPASPGQCRASQPATSDPATYCVADSHTPASGRNGVRLANVQY